MCWITAGKLSDPGDIIRRDMPGKGKNNKNVALVSHKTVRKVGRLITANNGDLREKVNALLEQYAPEGEKEANDNNAGPVSGAKRSIDDLEALDSSLIKLSKTATGVVQSVNAGFSEMQTSYATIEPTLVKLNQTVKIIQEGREVVMAMQEVCQSDGLNKFLKIHELRDSTTDKEIQLQAMKEMHSTNNLARAKEISQIEQAGKDNDATRAKEIALIEQAAKDNDITRAKEISQIEEAGREAAKDADIRRLKEAADIEVEKEQRLLQVRQAAAIIPSPLQPVQADHVHGVMVHNFNSIVKEVFNGPIKISLYTSAGAYVRSRGFDTFNDYTVPTADRVRALLEAWKEINPHRFQS